MRKIKNDKNEIIPDMLRPGLSAIYYFELSVTRRKLLGFAGLLF